MRGRSVVCIFDAGHGGVLLGEPQTSGKRSPMSLGEPMFEGNANRMVMYRVMEGLWDAGVPFAVVDGGIEDIPLMERVRRIERMSGEVKGMGCEPLVLSFHCNAGGGEGFEVWTSRGQTRSDLYAEELLKMYRAEFPDDIVREDRGDGDGDKEENYTILARSSCPAVLLEWGFMDNEGDLAKMQDPEIRERYSKMLIEFCCKCFEGEVG